MGTFLQVEPEALTPARPARPCATSPTSCGPATWRSCAASSTTPRRRPTTASSPSTCCKNANIAAGGVLPMCQDTGTAIVMGKKGQYVLTGGGDEAALARGIFDTYQTTNLRYSQMAPLDMYDEKNTGTNLPAQIEIYAIDGDAYKFLFMAKGGGSANKSYLFQETKALLNPTSLLRVPRREDAPLGTAACPPYHLAVVIGGTSAEYALKTAKLASARYLDALPTEGNELGRGFRDLELEAEVLELTQDVRHRRPVRRQVLLPRRARHPPAPPRRLVPGRPSPCRARPTARPWARSPPTASSSSSSSTTRPSTCPRSPTTHLGGDVVRIDLNRPMDEIRAQLSQLPGQDPPVAHRPADRRPRHRPRQAQGAPRRRRGPAAVPEGPRRLLRRPGQDPRGLRLGLVRPHHRRPHGLLRRPVPGRTAAAA